MKQLPRYRALRSMLCKLGVLLALATFAPAQEINRQVGEPIEGVDARVNTGVQRSVTMGQTAEEVAARTRKVQPSSSFGATSPSAASKSAGSTFGPKRMAAAPEPADSTKGSAAAAAPATPAIDTTPKAAAPDKLAHTRSTGKSVSQTGGDAQRHTARAPIPSGRDSAGPQSHLGFGAAQSHLGESGKSITSVHTSHRKSKKRGTSSSRLFAADQRQKLSPGAQKTGKEKSSPSKPRLGEQAH